MNVFISWSGDRSRCVAEALRPWLKQVINVLDPWISIADIGNGTRWRDHVAARLKASDFGIICLTPENLRSEWLLFEAGALSKAIDTAYVCPLLIGLEPSDISGPLAQFQATRAIRQEMRKLVLTINSALGALRRPDQELEEAFEVWWPKLERKIELLPSQMSESRPQRSDRELLEEILAAVRQQSRISPPTRAPEHGRGTRGTSNPFETELKARLEQLPGIYRAKVRASADSFHVEIDPDPSLSRATQRFEFPWDDGSSDSDGQCAIEKVSAYLQLLRAERQLERHSYAADDRPEMSRFRMELLRELQRRNLRFAADVIEHCRIDDFEGRLVFSAAGMWLLALKEPGFMSVTEKVYKTMFKNIPKIEVRQITPEPADQ